MKRIGIILVGLSLVGCGNGIGEKPSTGSMDSPLKSSVELVSKGVGNAPTTIGPKVKTVKEIYWGRGMRPEQLGIAGYSPEGAGRDYHPKSVVELFGTGVNPEDAKIRVKIYHPNTLDVRRARGRVDYSGLYDSLRTETSNSTPEGREEFDGRSATGKFTGGGSGLQGDTAVATPNTNPADNPNIPRLAKIDLYGVASDGSVRAIGNFFESDRYRILKVKTYWVNLNEDRHMMKMVLVSPTGAVFQIANTWFTRNPELAGNSAILAKKVDQGYELELDVVIRGSPIERYKSLKGVWSLRVLIDSIDAKTSSAFTLK